MIKSVCGSFCIACLHPLTRRYGARTSHTQSVAIIDLYQRIGHES
ncbi:hypothetical protein QO218_20555 [Vibrio vulnificus]|nr:hypothetical protein [Vibrio vulnificus]MDK2618107.1 hypothetical protein [Vibrio vulnificus]MDK2675072.1 hypothetical protein [Vibrio vulnificus]